MKTTVIVTGITAIVVSFVVMLIAKGVAPSGPTMVYSFGLCASVILGSFCGLIFATGMGQSARIALLAGALFAFPSVVSTFLAVSHQRGAVEEQLTYEPYVITAGMFYFDALDRGRRGAITEADIDYAATNWKNEDVRRVFAHMKKNFRLIGHQADRQFHWQYVITRGDLISYHNRLYVATRNWQ